METDTIPFKQVEKITVEKKLDLEYQALAEAAHPEITVTVTPPVFYVKFWASSAVFSVHASYTKAMTHAMELCGGGVTKKELF